MRRSMLLGIPLLLIAHSARAQAPVTTPTHACEPASSAVADPACRTPPQESASNGLFLGVHASTFRFSVTARPFGEAEGPETIGTGLSLALGYRFAERSSVRAMVNFHQGGSDGDFEWNEPLQEIGVGVRYSVVAANAPIRPFLGGGVSWVTGSGQGRGEGFSSWFSGESLGLTAAGGVQYTATTRVSMDVELSHTWMAMRGRHSHSPPPRVMITDVDLGLLRLAAGMLVHP